MDRNLSSVGSRLLVVACLLCSCEESQDGVARPAEDGVSRASSGDEHHSAGAGDSSTSGKDARSLVVPAAGQGGGFTVTDVEVMESEPPQFPDELVSSAGLRLVLDQLVRGPGEGVLVAKVCYEVAA